MTLRFATSASFCQPYPYLTLIVKALHGGSGCAYTDGSVLNEEAARATIVNRYSSIQLRSHNFTVIFAKDALYLALSQVENSDDDTENFMFFDSKSAFQAIWSRTG